MNSQILETEDVAAVRLVTYLLASDIECLPGPLLFLIAAYVPIHATCGNCNIAGCETTCVSVRTQDAQQNEIWYSNIPLHPWEPIPTAFQHHHCLCCTPRVPKARSKKCCDAIRCATCIATCAGCKCDICPECSIRCEMCKRFVCDNKDGKMKFNIECEGMYCHACSKYLCINCRVNCANKCFVARCKVNPTCKNQILLSECPNCQSMVCRNLACGARSHHNPNPASCNKLTCGKCWIVCRSCLNYKCIKCTYFCDGCDLSHNYRSHHSYCEECLVYDPMTQRRLCKKNCATTPKITEK